MKISDMGHMDHIDAVAAADCAHLREKHGTYMGSWKAAGGRSAWFMLRRKIDRLVAMMARPEPTRGFNLRNLDDTIAAIKDSERVSSGDPVIIGVNFPGTPEATVEMLRHVRSAYVAEDVFDKIQEDASGTDGTVLAEIRDLRRYLLLVEAEMVNQGIVSPQTATLPENLATDDSTEKRSAVRKIDGRPEIPATLQCSPPKPRDKQTREELLTEITYWNHWISTAPGPASAGEAHRQRRSCEFHLARLTHAKAGRPIPPISVDAAEHKDDHNIESNADVRKTDGKPFPPATLRVIPNVPHEKQTEAQLRAELAYWEERARTAIGASLIGEACRQARSCERCLYKIQEKEKARVCD